MIPRTSIDEANKHLNMLHKRVEELEKTVKEQHEALIAKDEFLQTKVSDVSSAKDEEIHALQHRLRESERTITVLQKQLEEKEQEILKANYKFNNVKTLLAHKNNVRHLLRAMDEAEAKVVGVVDKLVDHRSPAEMFTSNGFNEHTPDYANSDIKPKRKGSGKNQSKPPGKEFYL